MAVEDKKYDEMIKSVNALMATGRTAMVKGWLIKLAVDILKYYGYDTSQISSQHPCASDAQSPSTSAPPGAL